jgi:hypothetical protein
MTGEQMVMVKGETTPRAEHSNTARKKRMVRLFDAVSVPSAENDFGASRAADGSSYHPSG